MQRREQRLNDRHRPIMGTCVSPRFEEMRFRNMPMTPRAGFVVIRAEMNTKRHPIETRRERQVRRSSIHGIAAEDEQHIHVARVHFIHELAHGPGSWSRGHRQRVGHGLADVAEKIVERMRQRMNKRRLARPGNHEAGAAMSA